MGVLTEDDVRKIVQAEALGSKGILYLEDKQIITPSARAYLSEKNITIKKKKECVLNEVKMIPSETIIYETCFGGQLHEKPEHMTHLRGNLLVFKDHPRIILRGSIDQLEAEIICAQVIAQKQDKPKLIEDLQEILIFVRNLLRCEVSGEALGEYTLQQLDAKELREHSHHPTKYYGMGHFLPTYKHGEIVAVLNKLRTLTRETELVAYKAFTDTYGNVEREDLIKAFNRLSSLFWIMMFKYLTKKYDK